MHFPFLRSIDFLRKKYSGALVILALAAVLLPAILFGRRAASGADDTSFAALTNELFIQEATSSTITLHYTLENPARYGIDEVPIAYGNLSADGSSAQEYARYYLRLLHTFSPDDLSDANALTYEILEDTLENSLEMAEYALYQEPLSPLTGIHAQLPVLLAEFPLNDADDVADYLALLSLTPEYFRSIADFERAKSEQGLFCSDETLDEILQQCRDFVQMEDNYLISGFADRLADIPEMDDALKENYCEKNRQLVASAVLPAYRELIESLTKLRGTGTNDGGLCNFPEGRSFYEVLVRTETGSSRSIDELETMIAGQIAADAAKAAQTQLQLQEASGAADSTDTDADTDDADAADDDADAADDDARTQAKTYDTDNADARAKVTAYDADASVFALTPEETLQKLYRSFSGSFPTLSTADVQIKYVPEELEEHLSPAFYLIPPLDGSDGQTIYLNNAEEMEPLALFTTLAHEGYPGHMYQNAWMNASVESPLRRILNYGGYSEGWATYAEMTSYYVSGLSDAQATVEQSLASVNLGVCAYCDLKIHADGWTLADMQKYLRQYGVTDTAAVASTYRLILGDPANYLKYYVGFLEFLELKKEAKRTLSDVSENEFHRRILEIGPAPFDILREQVLER